MSFLREPNAEPLPGYRLIEPLGSGGFGEVWKCEAPGGLFKAIKFIYGNLNSLDTDGARAEQELHALHRVKEVRHPFVLSMERIEIVEGEVVLVTELADRSLHDSYTEYQQAGLVGIPRDALLRYLRDAAEALDHMNEKHNLQHLDIKPRNLFLVSDRVKVADFGLVKHLERASGVLGGVTPLYAAPETFAGKISPHSDQYSLAVVYQELLTGQRPFNGKNARQLAQQHLQEEPELRSLPEPERPVIARALSKDPAKRFPNCLALIRALYTAHNPIRSVESLRIDAAGAEGNRPKTMLDTLENILLEQVPDDEWRPLPEPASENGSEPVSELGITMHQPETGSLRPTLIIGVGSFGKRALLELRCRLLDRFGDLSKIPMLRFLYLDVDPDEIKQGTRGAADVALLPHEIHHLPLQTASQYRRRQLDQLLDWLPREKIWSIPRNLKTQGSRALARLAFSDNYLRLLARVRRDVQQACHPDAIYQSVSQTGLAVRDNVPRVYVIGAAGGGTSGMLPDLGFALRRLLHQLRHSETTITAYLLCGAPDDPATPRQEQANIYATLTELYHFTDPSIPFTAQYGTDGPRIVDQGMPFDCAYLAAMPNRTPEARQDAIAHVGSFLFHEMTTPLGLRLDQRRLAGSPAAATPFRTFGTYSVWFPRGLVLRLAARQAARRVIEEWQSAPGTGSGVRERRTLLPDGSRTESPEVEAMVAKTLADPGLRPEALAARVEEITGTGLEGTPAEALARMLASLEEQAVQSVAVDDPGNWAKQAVKRVQEWLGPGLGQTTDPRVALFQVEWRKSKLSRSLEAAAQSLAEEWEGKLTEAMLQLMEAPGRRVALAEAGFQRLMEQLQEEADAHKARLFQLAQKVPAAQQNLEQALDQCISGGGFSFFGGRSRRNIRVFMDHLAAFARQCLAEDLAGAVQLFWGRLQGRLSDRLRDLGFCRQRLRALQEALDEAEFNAIMPDLADTSDDALSPSPVASASSFWEAIRQSVTTQVVLPEGEDDLESVATRFLGRLTAEQWLQLDLSLQDRVLAPLGGLHRVCLHSGDIVRGLLSPLLDQIAACLGEHLPITDVAQVLTEGDAESDRDLPTQVEECHARAAPLILARQHAMTPIKGLGFDRPVHGKLKDAGSEGNSFLLIPASEAGKEYGESAQGAVQELSLVRVPGQNTLVYCREQGYLTLEELQRVLRSCRPAYDEAAVVPLTSPHARSDISDWLPLDP